MKNEKLVASTQGRKIENEKLKIGCKHTGK